MQVLFIFLLGDVRATPPRRKSFSRFLRTILQLSYPVSFYRFNSIEEYTTWRKFLVEGFAETYSNEIILKCEALGLETKISEEPLKSFGIEVDDISKEFIKVKKKYFAF